MNGQQNDIVNLPETVRSIEIERLPLPITIYNTLKTSGVHTLEQLADTLKLGCNVLNRSQKEKTKALITNLHLSLNEDEHPDWHRFCELSVLAMLPAQTPIKTDGDILKNVALIIEEILTSDVRDQRKWPVIQYRFGLNGKAIMTHVDLGHAFGGISRQAVEQFEKKHLRELREALINKNYSGKTYLIDDRVTEYIVRIRSVIAAEAAGFLPEDVLIARLIESTGTTVRPDPAALSLLFELFGMSRIKELPKGIPTLWKVGKSFDEKRLRKALEKLEQIFTKDYLPPMEEIELLSKLNRSMGRSEAVSPAELHQILPLCDYVETTSDGEYQARIERIQSRAGQAERLLIEAGEPVDVKVLTDRLNRILTPAGLRKVEYLNFANVMSTDKRFVPEGKGGRRGLKRWSSTTTKTILELMEEALTARSSAASETEILGYVKQRRPVNAKSITTYLSAESRFKKVGFDQWQLTSKKVVESFASVDAIGKAVIEEFDRRGVTEMPFPELLAAVSGRTDVAPNRLRGILRHHPVVNGSRVGSATTTTATLNRNYEVDKPLAKRKRTARLKLFANDPRSLFESC